MSEQQQEVQRNHIVRIHIDQHRYESPSPTTGEALYLLGKVAPGSDLYREVEGNREDQPVWDDGEEIHLREDEHFHSGPAATITVIVNGRKKEAPSRVLTFMQVVALAFDPVPQRSGVGFHRDVPEGREQTPRGHLNGGRDRHSQERCDLQCHSN